MEQKEIQGEDVFKGNGNERQPIKSRQQEASTIPETDIEENRDIFSINQRDLTLEKL